MDFEQMIYSNKPLSFVDISLMNLTHLYMIPASVYSISKFQQKYEPLSIFESKLPKEGKTCTFLLDNIHNVQFYVENVQMIEKYCDACKKHPMERYQLVPNFPQTKTAVKILHGWYNNEIKKKVPGFMPINTHWLPHIEPSLQLTEYVDWLQMISWWKTFNSSVTLPGKVINYSAEILGGIIPFCLANLNVKVMNVLDYYYTPTSSTRNEILLRTFYYLRKIEKFENTDRNTLEIQQGILSKQIMDLILFASVISLEIIVRIIVDFKACNVELAIHNIVSNINEYLNPYAHSMNITIQDAVGNLKIFMSYIVRLVSKTYKCYKNQLLSPTFHAGKKLYGLARLSSECVEEMLCSVASHICFRLIHSDKGKNKNHPKALQIERDIEYMIKTQCRDVSEIILNVSKTYFSIDTINYLCTSVITRNKTKVNLNHKVHLLSSIMSVMKYGGQVLNLKLNPKVIILSTSYLEDDFINVFDASAHCHGLIMKEVVHNYRIKMNEIMKNIENYIISDKKRFVVLLNELFSFLHQLSILRKDLV